MVGVYAGVEGDTDEGLLESILKHVGLYLEGVFGRNGKDALLRDLPRWNEAAKFFPWVVIVDLDSEDCVVTAVHSWLPNPTPGMLFRVAVREAEAWLLGDPDMVSQFLGVSRALIPTYPENLSDPKATLVRLAARSRKRAIREGLVPRDGSGRSIGPTYSSDIAQFARTSWRPEVASQNCPSLAGLLIRLRALGTAE